MSKKSKNRTKEGSIYFSNTVRNRDKWVCQKCGSTEYLQAHHTHPVSEYPLFEALPQYGITLCVYCHADAHPELPRGLFISSIIQTEKEGKISAGKLAKELGVQSQTIVCKATKFGILKPFQKWVFTKEEADIIRGYLKPKRENINFSYNLEKPIDNIGKIFLNLKIELGSIIAMNTLIDFIASAPTLTIKDLTEITNLERYKIKGFVMILLQKHFLKKEYTYYRKTPAFLQWINEYNTKSWIFTEINSPKLKKKNQRMPYSKLNLSEIEQVISGLQIPIGGASALKEVLSYIADAQQLTISDLIDVTGLERPDIKRLISTLVRKRAIKKKYTFYVKTPAFIRWLKKHIDKISTFL